jgi:signal transduction histidine kinase
MIKDKKMRIENEYTTERWRLPGVLRILFERKLYNYHSEGKHWGFEACYAKNHALYTAHIMHAFANVLDLTGGCSKVKENMNQGQFLENWVPWHQGAGIEVITWHYNTRHDTGSEYASENRDPKWITGQSLTGRLRMELRRARIAGRTIELNPYPGGKSPQMNSYAEEVKREENSVGGPIGIHLLSSKADVATYWGGRELAISEDITKILTRADLHEGNNKVPELGYSDLREIVSKRSFMETLIPWMGNYLKGKLVSEEDAIPNLLASLKVTLILLKSGLGKLPRSTCLCPVFVAAGEEEVGNMAFACNGLIARDAALIGEMIAQTLLTHLRLLEDGLSRMALGKSEYAGQLRRLLVSRVIHDVKHPAAALLSSIKASIETMGAIEEQIKYLQTAMDQTLITLEDKDPLKGILIHKRMDNIGEFLADLQFYQKSAFQQKGKTLEIASADPDWSFYVDRNLITEILASLLANALEHGGNQVQVSVNRIVSDKGKAIYHIHVRDNGKGIPDEIRKNLFQLFPRGYSGTSGRKARGLGLAIIRLLLQRHGAEISYVPGEGEWKTDFVVSIPEGREPERGRRK